MKQEYLLLDEQEKKEISEYKPENVQTKLFSVENDKGWYVELSCEGNNLTTAKRLSEVDAYVRKHFKVTILQNDSSAYFSNRLYPIMSGFERKLRKVLYIFSAINKDEEAAKNIEKLEEKDFGTIFTMLFVDDGFMSAAKDVVKNTQRENFSKDGLLKLLESKEEKTVWDKLLGNEVVPTLRKRYQDVRTIRNHIMHSHDFGWETYNEAQKLIKTINKEIDEAINDVSIKENVTKKSPSFNRTLAYALRTYEQFGQVVNNMLPKLYNAAEISNALARNFSPGATRIAEIANRLVFPIQLSPEMTRAIDQMRSLSDAIVDSPALRAAQESAQMMANLYRDNPGLVEAQRQAEQVSRMLQDNPAILEMQEQESGLSQLTQGWNINTNINDDINETNDDGGSENGEDENGIDGHDGTEHRED